MIEETERKARLSYVQAETYARRARLAEIEEERDVLLRLQKGWLALARSYEFALQLLEFSRKATHPFSSFRRKC